MAQTEKEDILKFFGRIGLCAQTPIEPTEAFLGLIQSHCIQKIAYENLDILRGRKLDLSPHALYEKIVVKKRGGYCFELNGFLKYMLLSMGFDASDRFARFLRGEEGIPMRRHRVCVVTLGQEKYLCDIGVGQYMPRYPLKIEENTLQTQGDEIYRFQKDPVHGWVLWEMHAGAWRQLISFAEYPAFDIDFVQPTFFCENSEASIFNKAPMIAIKTPDGRKAISGRDYKIFRGEELIHIETDITKARYYELLQKEFFIQTEENEFF